MRKLGLIQTEQGTYKIKKQEKGFRRTTEPRCPLQIYEKNSDGGWSHLETLDAEKPEADKSMVFTSIESDAQSWENAIEAIRFYDDSEIIKERKQH